MKVQDSGNKVHTENVDKVADTSGKHALVKKGNTYYAVDKTTGDAKYSEPAVKGNENGEHVAQITRESENNTASNTTNGKKTANAVNDTAENTSNHSQGAKQAHTSNKTESTNNQSVKAEKATTGENKGTKNEPKSEMSAAEKRKYENAKKNGTFTDGTPKKVNGKNVTQSADTLIS